MPTRLNLTSGLALVLLGCMPAAAQEEWRYCLAQDETLRQVYLSEIFRSPDDVETVETEFNAWLDRAGLPHARGVCPRAASRGAADAARQAAERYARGQGFTGRVLSWPKERS